MAIEITTKRDGFRRGGLAHHGTRVYPDTFFSAGPNHNHNS